MTKSQIPRQPPIVFAEACDRGLVREENQDSVLHILVALGHLLIVADGIGGYQGGAVASRMVVESFRAHLASLPHDYPAAQAIEEASARANADVIAAASAPGAPYSRMGSTVVLALVQFDAEGFRAWIGHIGDSRAYLVRAGQLSRITNDHSAVQALLNRNLITPEQAINHPDASVLTRSIGHHPKVEIDIEMVPLMPGDSLLLCSDGLWGFVPEEEIQKVAANPALTADAAAKALLQLALNAGGHDNIGIQLARMADPAPLTPPAPPNRQRGSINPQALALLILTALSGLLFVAQRYHWFHALRLLR